MSFGNMDLELLLSLNSLAGSAAQKLFVLFVDNALIRGFPIFVPLVALWFSSDCVKRRSRMLVGLLATSVATILSIWLQHRVLPHIRPLLDPALHLKIADPKWTTTVWDRQGSFPSDTATLYFALVAVIFIENRLAGYFCFLWALTIIGFSRVIVGYHYPSDIVGSMILGPGCIYLFTKISSLRTLFERVLTLCENRMYLVNALLFVYLADAFNLFASLQQLKGIGLHLLKVSSPVHVMP